MNRGTGEVDPAAKVVSSKPEFDNFGERIFAKPDPYNPQNSNFVTRHRPSLNPIQDAPHTLKLFKESKMQAERQVNKE